MKYLCLSINLKYRIMNNAEVQGVSQGVIWEGKYLMNSIINIESVLFKHYSIELLLYLEIKLIQNLIIYSFLFLF